MMYGQHDTCYPFRAIYTQVKWGGYMLNNGDPQTSFMDLRRILCHNDRPAIFTMLCQVHNQDLQYKEDSLKHTGTMCAVPVTTEDRKNLRALVKRHGPATSKRGMWLCLSMWFDTLINFSFSSCGFGAYAALWTQRASILSTHRGSSEYIISSWL